MAPTLLALGYVLGGYAGGWLLILSPSGAARAGGVVLLAHAMVIAAYLLHECAHGTIMRGRAGNARLGELLSFLCGGAYASFARIRHMHLRHHRDKGDLATFDYRAFLRGGPAWLRGGVLALEWACVPAVELLMRAQVIVRPFLAPRRGADRARVAAVLAVRGGVALWLAAFAPGALLAYGVAALLRLTLLSVGDAFHHRYEFHRVQGDEPVPTQAYDRAYEDAHTFSTLLSARHPWVNLLALNFVYHNAHHRRAGVAWHRLPALHRELYGESAACVRPLPALLRAWHRERVRSVLDEHATAARGVSFLSVV